MDKSIIIFAMIGLVLMLGFLYNRGLRLAEEDLYPVENEQTLFAAIPTGN